MEPFEIIGQPLELWLAPVGTAFPLITAAPSGSWTLVGTSGTRSENEEGVAVTHGQTLNKVRTGGAVGPVKVFRNEEELSFRVTLLDVSLEQYRLALNANALTTTAAGTGTAGFKSVGLSRGRSVTTYALLARGMSPYGPSFQAQYQVPRCYQSASPQVVYRKGQPAGIELMFEALEDPAAASEAVRFGSLIAQHQAAL